MTAPNRVSLLVFVVASFSLASAAGCAGGGGPPGGRSDTGIGDGGAMDSSRDAAADSRMIECTTNADCTDDGVFCNGSLACTDGRCVASAIPTCDDFEACTVDTCSATMDECQHVPSDALCATGLHCYPPGGGCIDAVPCEFDGDCDDSVYCNGPESCVDGLCSGPGTRDCSDTSTCTLDECVEAMGSCGHVAYTDSDTNVAHCGSGDMCIACPAPDPSLHAVASCMGGVCGSECELGYVDLDMNPANGCEFACTIVPGTDFPDDTFTDANCDGIDGDRARAIFVSTTGSDANDGLTSATPVGSFTRAFAVFAANPTRVQILVVNGTYATSAELSLPSGVGIYGGYAAGFVARTDSRAQILASSPTAMRAQGLTSPTLIDRVNLTTANQTTASVGTATLIVRDSGDWLTLRFVTVLAGRGGDGAAGTPGSRGSDGTNGSNGSGASGGGGGSVGGGGGATGVNRAAGPAGGAGSGGSCGTGGSQGSGSGGGGLGCSDGDPQPGGDGGDGCTGLVGTGGGAGDGLGTLSSTGVWTASTAPSGGTGGRGGGGGGGGAGGGEDCRVLGSCVYCDTGRGGGGGGGGGAGGTGGGGGRGGGVSIAIVLLDSTITLQGVRVQTVGGGNGGTGAAGGAGGNGGAGGIGATASNSSQGRGGLGGDGGGGGTGGCGGGGGGGPSIGIWGNGPTAQYRELSATVMAIGPGGNGGSSCGTGGSSGTSSNTRDAYSM